MDELDIPLEEQLKALREERHARKSVVIERARTSLRIAQEDRARGIEVDHEMIRELEKAIAEYERYTIERPGLPPEN